MSHELKKFKEWTAKAENAYRKKGHQLRYTCQKLMYWSARLKETDPYLFANEIRAEEYSMIARSLPILHEQYNQYLLDSKRHGIFTKIKQEKIMRFVYMFTKYVFPLAEEVGDDDFLRTKIRGFISEYLSDAIFDLSNLDEYEINALLRLLDKAHDLKITDILPVRAIVEAEILDRQLAESTAEDLKGESVQVEFKAIFPEKILTLAKEIAAFGSTEGGRIYLGVDDNRGIIGIHEEEILSSDKFQQRIAGIASQTIRPSISVTVKQYSVGDKMIIQINVPKGSEPVYYVRNVPYIRALTTSRPATPLEVKSLHLRHFVDYLQNTL